jgi:hypothetical protein
MRQTDDSKTKLGQADCEDVEGTKLYQGPVHCHGLRSDKTLGFGTSEQAGPT